MQKYLYTKASCNKNINLNFGIVYNMHKKIKIVYDNSLRMLTLVDKLTGEFYFFFVLFYIFLIF